MTFSETDAALYIAVVRRRLQELVREGRIQQNADGTFNKHVLDNFIKRVGVNPVPGWNSSDQ